MKLFLIHVITFLSISSFGQTVSDRTITIGPNLSFQYYEHFKRLTLNSPDSPIEYLDGFNFKWGYTYKVSVKETKLRFTMSDGTQYDYSLNHIISKTKAPDSTQFKLFLTSSRYYHQVDSSEQLMNITLKLINDSTYNYFDKVEIEVPDNLKIIFNQIVEGKTSKLGHFIYINEKRIRLVHL
jgi:predicted ATPase